MRLRFDHVPQSCVVASVKAASSQACVCLMMETDVCFTEATIEVELLVAIQIPTHNNHSLLQDILINESSLLNTTAYILITQTHQKNMHVHGSHHVVATEVDCSDHQKRLINRQN